VQIQLEPQTEQDVARVLVAGPARITQSAEEDCVDVVAQMVNSRVRQCLLGAEIMIGRIREALPLQRESMLGGDAIEDRNRGLDYFRPDSVSRDHGNFGGPTVRPSDRPS